MAKFASLHAPFLKVATGDEKLGALSFENGVLHLSDTDPDDIARAAHLRKHLATNASLSQQVREIDPSRALQVAEDFKKAMAEKNKGTPGPLTASGIRAAASELHAEQMRSDLQHAGGDPESVDRLVGTIAEAGNLERTVESRGEVVRNTGLTPLKTKLDTEPPQVEGGETKPAGISGNALAKSLAAGKK